MAAGAQREPKTGVLVIRAWMEREGPDGLRVRITSTLDVTQTAVEVSVAAAAHDVLAIVERWIEDVRAGP